MRYTLMWWYVAHRHAHLFSERRNVFVFDQRFLDELIARSDIVDVVSGYVRLSKKSFCEILDSKMGMEAAKYEK